jgi:nitroreductase
MLRRMQLIDLVSRCRSYRRFDERVPVGEETLRALVALARQVPSAANRQPLKYVLSCAAEWNMKIFETLAWAAYLKDWPGPGPGERPTAYIVVLLDTSLTGAADIDVGIAAQTILLAAVEQGLGGCMFGAIRREELARRLSLPENTTIALVIALGKPVEKVILEDLPADGSIRYYRDAHSVHHVPKRPVAELIHAVYA